MNQGWIYYWSRVVVLYMDLYSKIMVGIMCDAVYRLYAGLEWWLAHSCAIDYFSVILRVIDLSYTVTADYYFGLMHGAWTIE